MTPSRWKPAYLGLGSNLGDSIKTIREATDKIAAHGACRVVAISPLYRSEPWGYADQPDYINGVIGILTQLEADQLLQTLLVVEREYGRSRSGPRFGPRTLDLDLLLFSDQNIDQEQLVVPHPRMHLRNFVIYPLADIAPTIHIGKLGTCASLRRQLAPEGLIRIH